MRTSLLTTEPEIAEWFSENYPEMVICDRADDRFWEAELMIITAFYDIDGEHYQILDLWEKFVKIRHRRKKLIVYGWAEFYSKNYLNAAQMPKLDSSWALEVKRAGGKNDQKPRYPNLLDKDIVDSIGRLIHSHGERAFHKILSEVQTYLRRVERALREGHHRTVIQEMEEMKKADILMNSAKNVWENRIGFFSLMPQFRELADFEDLWVVWERLRDFNRESKPRLSQQIGNYIENTLIDIVRLYNIEKES